MFGEIFWASLSANLVTLVLLAIFLIWQENA